VIISGYKQPPPDRPVGLVINPDYVIGEWNGKTWDRIPNNAQLFLFNLAPFWRLYHDGNAAIRRWTHLYDNGNRRVHYPSSVIYGGFGLYTTREVFKDSTPEESFNALVEWAEFLRSQGGGIASLTGASRALWKATLGNKTFKEYSKDIPSDRLLLGARQESIGPGSFPNVECWDIEAAYAHALGTLELPRSWKEYNAHSCFGSDSTKGVPDYGFVEATVEIPKMAYGPLPVRQNGAIRYPTDTLVKGIWTVFEIQAAVGMGCEISPISSWSPNGRMVKPFADWWEAISYARTELSPLTRQLFKTSSNTFWGSFAMAGQTFEYTFGSSGLKRRPIGGILRPLAPAISALVSGKVRSRLFSEALSKWPIISCHTDGVISLTPLMYPPNGTGPGTWRLKQKARVIDIVGPQVMRIESYDGEESFKIAGTVLGRVDAEDTFRHSMFRAMKRQGEIDVRNERLAWVMRNGI
jgi:hypothetical protein